MACDTPTDILYILFESHLCAKYPYPLWSENTLYNATCTLYYYYESHI